ncbi:hypothetical protein V8G54_011195 [Vigna mungo]|uniref:Uncharacterized protein n=1 Tax=Vigna mungo TaxID=3915 RepID=A0AAQ3RZE0_VIGMU
MAVTRGVGGALVATRGGWARSNDGDWSDGVVACEPKWRKGLRSHRRHHWRRSVPEKSSGEMVALGSAGKDEGLLVHCLKKQVEQFHLPREEFLKLQRRRRSPRCSATLSATTFRVPPLHFARRHYCNSPPDSETATTHSSLPSPKLQLSRCIVAPPLPSARRHCNSPPLHSRDVIFDETRMAMHPENSGSEKKILVEVEHTTNGAGTPGGTEENQTGEGQVENGRTIEENRSDEFRTDLGDDTDGTSGEGSHGKAAGVDLRNYQLVLILGMKCIGSSLRTLPSGLLTGIRQACLSIATFWVMGWYDDRRHSYKVVAMVLDSHILQSCVWVHNMGDEGISSEEPEIVQIFSYDLKNDTYRYLSVPEVVLKRSTLTSLEVLNSCLYVSFNDRERYFVVLVLKDVQDVRLVSISLHSLSISSLRMPVFFTMSGDMLLLIRMCNCIIYNLKDNKVERTQSFHIDTPVFDGDIISFDYVPSLISPI